MSHPCSPSLRNTALNLFIVYVLEASTSNRLTHFYPPLNLIPLIFIRPLRLFVSAENLRNTRITLLKATHAPIVGAIWLFERAQDTITNGGAATFSGPGSSDTGEFNIDIASTPGFTAKKQKPFLSKSNTNRSSMHFTDGPAEDGSHSPSPQTPKAEHMKKSKMDSVVSSSDLEQKVDELTQKIEVLTALIMAQQGGSTEEE